jgi:hypothetical protein
VLRQAAQQGLITAIVKDRYYRNDRIVAFASMIRDRDPIHGSTCAADFRDTLNVGRKLAIQILEYFDRIGFTRRRGNDISCAIKRCFSLVPRSLRCRATWCSRIERAAIRNGDHKPALTFLAVFAHLFPDYIPS